ncbi:MAG: tetratricopeptide repeat protein [Thermoanaerobaculales bacterium]|nr:tetratricopeptide repeat protein [Thermoanaerobaculales bacterium]
MNGYRRCGAGRLAAVLIGMLLCGRLQEAAAQGLEPGDAAADGASPGHVVPTSSLGGIEPRGAALLLSGQRGGEVPGAVLWTLAGDAGEAGEAAIVVLVEVDGRELLAGSDPSEAPVEIYGYLVDNAGAVAGHLEEGLLVSRRELADRISRGGLKFVAGLTAPPGLYSLRVLVRNLATRRFFLARQELDLRPAEAVGLRLLPPLVAEPGAGWVVAAAPAVDPARLLAALPLRGRWPSAFPGWPSAEPLELVLATSPLGDGHSLSAQLLDRSGTAILDPEVAVGAELSPAGGLASHAARVAVPDLPPGEYRLALSLTDRDSGEAVSHSLPVVIHDRPQALAWTDPEAPRAAVPAAPPVRAAAATSTEIEDARLRAAYESALRRWAAGDAVAARRELSELERTVVGAPSTRSWRRLFNLEQLAVLALAERRPAAVMGAAMLHRDMHPWYMARRETDLAEHSWQLAAMIARVAGSITVWRPPAGFSECLLLDLASRLAAIGQWRGTRRALEVAAEVAPGSAAAWLGLGALHERTGDPDEAASALERLLRDHPGHPEGRLRLAVNRARLGSERAAEELMRGLLEPGTPLWIRTLAYQELCGLLIASNRSEQAVALVREAVAQIPDNQRLRILEVYALDSAGRSRESAAAVARLEGSVSQASTSPRYRYSRWPDLDGERVRATLAEAERAGRAALAEELP